MSLLVFHRLIRSSLSHERQASRVVDALTHQLVEADATAQRYRRLMEGRGVTELGSFELNATTATFTALDAAAQIFGIPSRSQLDLVAFVEAVHHDDRSLLYAALERCAKEHEPVDVEHRLLPADGNVRWVETTANWTIGRDGCLKVAGTVFDAADPTQGQDSLMYQDSGDTLTGLVNRDLFLGRVEQAVQHGRPSVAVLFVDLDDFKAINERVGDAVGDQLMSAVAKRIASVAPAGDTVAQLGSDEFALLLESGQMPDAAEEVARKIADALRPPFYLGDTEVTVRASVGIAVGEPSGSRADLLRDADVAMHMAKGNGKNRFETARPGTADKGLTRAGVVNDLRRAVDDDTLDVFYQPIVITRDGTPTGAEALLRWNHPRRGLVPPIEFMAVAEDAGLVVPLGDWVLNRACRQAQAWRQAGIVEEGFYISVNISARQLAEPGLVENVARAIHESGLPPAALVLEITESTLMLLLVVGLARLQALKGLGVRLALDNLGARPSSLTRLGALPIDIVKIDKTTIDHVAESAEGRALVAGILEVTESLGIGSIAQGVEQQAQRDALDEIGCHCFQGHLIAAPMLPDDTAALLQRLAKRTVASTSA
jgi:diguanylate cyclase (GGDEF)-like protein